MIKMEFSLLWGLYFGLQKELVCVCVMWDKCLRGARMGIVEGMPAGVTFRQKGKEEPCACPARKSSLGGKAGAGRTVQRTSKKASPAEAQGVRGI